MYRIAHLTATFPPYAGGAGNAAFRFATEQAARGHHVEVFTTPAPGTPPGSGGVTVHRIEPALSYGNAPLLPRIAGIAGFDVVHLHYPFIFGSELVLLGRLRRRSRGQALLVHYKNQLVGRGVRGAMFRAYEHTVAPALVRAADRVCVLSADHAESVPYLRHARARDPEKLIEMPNGVDVEAFSPQTPGGRASGKGLREALGIPADATVAAFVATLDRAHRFKRLDLAMEALRRVASQPIHLVVAGGGELLEHHRAAAAKAGVGDRVHFLGEVPHSELPAVLRAADLFLLTTEPPESFGIVLIEAMATGLPVIASDYPGVRAVVNEGETGLLIRRGDPHAAAAALARLSADREARQRLGAAGRARAQERWSWPRLVDRMDEAYGQAIAARRKKARS